MNTTKNVEWPFSRVLRIDKQKGSVTFHVNGRQRASGYQVSGSRNRADQALRIALALYNREDPALLDDYLQAIREHMAAPPAGDPPDPRIAETQQSWRQAWPGLSTQAVADSAASPVTKPVEESADEVLIAKGDAFAASLHAAELTGRLIPFGRLSPHAVALAASLLGHTPVQAGTTLDDPVKGERVVILSPSRATHDPVPLEGAVHVCACASADDLAMFGLVPEDTQTLEASTADSRDGWAATGTLAFRLDVSKQEIPLADLAQACDALAVMARREWGRTNGGKAPPPVAIVVDSHQQELARLTESVDVVARWTA